MQRLSCYFALTVVCCVTSCAALHVELFKVRDIVYLNSEVSLIDRYAQILCSFNPKTVYVYFENDTSAGYPTLILKKLTECGTSFVSLRNKYKTAPLQAIQDDGILMYLVLIIKDASQSIDLNMVKKKSASKHRSHFFVIVENPIDIDERWLRTAFEKFWEIWILNAVIMFPRNNENQIYTYSPFSKRFLRRIDANSTHRDLFPRNMPNMNGRPLRICLFPDEVRAIFQPTGRILGADGFMSTFITSRLNATRVVKLPDGKAQQANIRLFTNTSGDFCLGEIINAASDMALNTRFLSPDLFQLSVEHSVVYGRDDLCVLVPKAPPASLFWNLFRSFQIPVWLAISLTLLTTYGFCRILLPRAELVFIKLYSSMLMQPMEKSPDSISVRLFLICWLGYCLLITGAFKSNLTSNLVFRISLPEVDTLGDLADSTHEILMYARHQKLFDRFLDSSIPHLRKLKQKTIPVADNFLIQKLDENDLSYAYLEKFHVGYFRVNSRKHSHHGRPLFHLMSTCPIPFQSVYLVPYGSPYLGFLDIMVRRAHEHGFVEHWSKVMDTVFKHSGKSVVRNSQNDDDPVVLRFAHLQAAFCILGLGLALGTGLLLWEIYRVYGIRTFIYNRQRWDAEKLKAIRNALLKK